MAQFTPLGRVGSQSRLFDVDFLTHRMALWIQNQDLILCRYHRDPAAAKGDRLRCYACGQGDLAWQAGAIGRQADDKQSNYHYKPANHHHGQGGHQSTQKSELRRLLLNFRLGRISHGQPPD